MAESFELYHVPQQTRRDKLRVTTVHGSVGSISSFDTENPNFMGFPENPQITNNNNSNFTGYSKQGLSLSLSSSNGDPPGAFTGYTSILKGSVFLRPAQQLLQEICHEFGGFCSGDKLELDSSLFDPLTDYSYSSLDDDHTKSRLISMLDEVCRRYRQYYQQLQAVMASFESIPGLNNATPFTNFALKSLSKHFQSLKTAIIDQLQFTSKPQGNITGRKHGQSDENDNFALYNQRLVPNSPRFVDNQPVWRPQRGLPERAVSVLRSWLFEHFLHPYPTDTDKLMLAKQTGLSRNQVSNWFINARVRLWKPMVEEIHSLETQQQTHQIKTTALSSHTKSALKLGKTTTEDHHASTSSQVPDHVNPPEKRVRNEPIDYGQFGFGPQGGSSVNDVSLTLGLHQNSHGMNGLLDPYPTLALAHRYGLSSGHDDDGQFRAGQISHDFIG